MDMRQAALVFSLLFVTSLIADSIEQRTAELVAMFNKTKNVQKKKKGGIDKSIFLQVRSDAVAPASGTFAADDFGHSITLDVRNDGTVTGMGLDRGTYTLRDARVRGSLLSGTKVYANGTTAPLEAVFLRRTVREGTSPDRVTSEQTALGLGVRTHGLETHGMRIERVFYEAR